MDEKAIGAAIAEAATPFGVAVSEPAAEDLRYSRLYAELGGDAPDDPYPLALEYVYEGYLLHYRTSRVMVAAPLERRLLAGDHFDALGLHEVARRDDLDSVELLTRLMAVGSWLRSEDAPLEWDDDLWTLTVAAIASLRGGGNAVAALNVFDELERLIGRDRAARLPDVVRRGAATLSLRDPRPLRAALGLEAADGESETEAADGEEESDQPGGGAPPRGETETVEAVGEEAS